MKNIKLLSVIFLLSAQYVSAQQKTDDYKEIISIINKYSKSVIEKDSVAFYGLFNDDAVTWCAALKERSQKKESEKKLLNLHGAIIFQVVIRPL